MSKLQTLKNTNQQGGVFALYQRELVWIRLDSRRELHLILHPLVTMYYLVRNHAAQDNGVDLRTE